MCNFGKFINFGLGTVRNERVKHSNTIPHCKKLSVTADMLSYMRSCVVTANQTTFNVHG